MAEATITLAGFVLTLMVFSYLLGDLPYIGNLYRIAVYIFVGMAAAFTAIVSYEGLLLPYLQDIQDPTTSWTALGSGADIVIFSAAALIGALLLLKPIGALSWLTNSVFAVLIVVGAAVAAVGALSGTLIPLMSATGTLPAAFLSDFTATVDALLIVLGTCTGLYYFHYQARAGDDGAPAPSRLSSGLRYIGKAFLVTALGAIYASTLLSSLTILTERIGFLFSIGG